MKPNNLSEKGLSMTQAQSISNLIYQHARLIDSQLNAVNNAHKSIFINGSKYDVEAPKSLPKNITELIIRKATLHAAQSFLMENLKWKAQWLQQERQKQFTTELKAPETPVWKQFVQQEEVDGEWAINQLSATEYNEFLQEEALAAHIGQFIHQEGKLDKLRKALPDEKALRFHRWTSQGTVTEIPIDVIVHHTEDELIKLHSELSALHRESEKRVNYYKAKLLNLVNEENARITRANKDTQADVDKHNSILRKQYDTEYQEYQNTLSDQKKEFSAKQLETVNKISKLRIEVDPRFKKVIDEFSSLIPDTEAQ